MSNIRLAKLPDRSPVKLTVWVTPELSKRLEDYAAVYSETYGMKEPVTELVPAMLATFLESDRVFSRRKGP
ncbi:MAG: DUF2274 domain-containing protein [Oxalobacteraceae bacterium]|nr:MAG: DUF2274 domain-containing protein [Oxalobacteraceae bacterium]